jgi:hypothetical protein
VPNADVLELKRHNARSMCACLYRRAGEGERMGAREGDCGVHFCIFAGTRMHRQLGTSILREGKVLEVILD